MSLSRSKAEELGLAFSQEGTRFPADPDVEVYEADLTLGGHTAKLTGRSEESILVQAESLLKQEGRLENEDSERHFEARPGLPGQSVTEIRRDAETHDSDVHDARDEGDNPS